jgi:ABC-type uncharacterized transport system ATPase subunit
MLIRMLQKPMPPKDRETMQIRLYNVSKRFRDTTANVGVSLDMREGKVVAVR